MQTSLETKPHTGVSGVLRFRYIGPFEVAELAELWGALHRQHTTIASHLEDLLGSVSVEESWRRRSRRYVEWLSEPDTIAVIAESDGVDVGYAMVTVRDEYHGSWDRGDRVAVVQTLSVHPDHSLDVVGGGLLDEVRRQLAEIGVRDLELPAVSGNSAAIRFYESQGFRPFVTTMVSRIGAGPHD
ncbi:GNAT family N-acetyltransferase [Thermobifida alba]|uniref:GNAT family N-acetyltransferase n=1 Tax=Thermobifida alba TaxID=53522 RepID=A0ABY4L024_THEAE|nr:GNAT family N-acetyltransferase [Thermobifida alba]UPT20286.1 GNAT family N-acetyltransferase [Thermobifida alba]HLU95466.1 GNAT family N-acetyltransferase [Thermobifida alba]